MLDLIVQFLDLHGNADLASSVLQECVGILSRISWMNIAKIALFVFLNVTALCTLYYVNEKIYNYYARRRVREHHLTIRNNGNTPSVYMLRPVGLSKSMMIDFYSGGNPMILVTQQKKEIVPEEKAKAEDVPAQQEKVRETAAGGSGLIPNLNDPMKPIDTVRDTATNVGRKAGLLASIIGTVTSLLPIKNKTLDEGAKKLKDVQQTTSNTVGDINNKINSADTLKRQVGSLGPKKGPAMEKVGEMRDDLHQQITERGETAESDRVWLRSAALMSNFVYDEKVWRKNVGKTDENGGALNYAQSRVLKPGDSVRIDLQIRNRSLDLDAVSRLYKIEIWQVPQTSLHLAAPRQMISGIVSFPKISSLEQHIPLALLIAQTILLGLLIALCSRFIFYVK